MMMKTIWALALSKMTDEEAARFINENPELCKDNGLIDRDTANRIINERAQLEVDQKLVWQAAAEQAKKEWEEKVKQNKEEYDTLRKFKEEHTWEEYVEELKRWTKENLKNKCNDKVNTYLHLYVDETNEIVDKLRKK